MNLPQVVSPAEWDAARAALLVKEKEATRARDALAAQRRRLPMVRVEKQYDFQGPDGTASLLDLFDGRRQLIVYHHMLQPGDEDPCSGCSMFTDGIVHLAHLHARDTSLVLVSRAPAAEIEAFKKRMGWTVPWYSSAGNSFDADFGVTTGFGLNVFLRDHDQVFRTYFTTGRGVEGLGSAWSFLDLTPLGRQETWEDSPEGWPQTPPYEWWRLHDEYPARPGEEETTGTPGGPDAPELPGAAMRPGDLDPPARELIRLLEGVTDDQLSASTPCAEYTVGDLLDHLMGLTIAFRNAATKSTGPAEHGTAENAQPGSGSSAHLDPDWRTRLPLQLHDLVAAWQDPAAWQGMAEAGGVTMPADVMGRVALNELVLHGWDLARGTGQPFECTLRCAEVCFELVSEFSGSGEEERPEGLFGPAVDVPPDAPLLHRLLGLSGRDPGWTPRLGPETGE